MEHLSSFNDDGATVADSLFDGGRLSYPGRNDIEYQLGYAEPYSLLLESRIVDGFSKKMTSAIRLLANQVSSCIELDSTLDLLWSSHSAWSVKEISLDRLVAALVMVELLRNSNVKIQYADDLCLAAEIFIRELHILGFPPNAQGLEELFDGAPPACVGLGLVDL